MVSPFGPLAARRTCPGHTGASFTGLQNSVHGGFEGVEQGAIGPVRQPRRRAANQPSRTSTAQVESLLVRQPLHRAGDDQGGGGGIVDLEPIDSSLGLFAVSELEPAVVLGVPAQYLRPQRRVGGPAAVPRGAVDGHGRGSRMSRRSIIAPISPVCFAAQASDSQGCASHFPSMTSALTTVKASRSAKLQWHWTAINRRSSISLICGVSWPWSSKSSYKPRRALSTSHAGAAICSSLRARSSFVGRRSAISVSPGDPHTTFARMRSNITVVSLGHLSTGEAAFIVRDALAKIEHPSHCRSVGDIRTPESLRIADHRTVVHERRIDRLPLPAPDVVPVDTGLEALVQQPVTDPPDELFDVSEPAPLHGAAGRVDRHVGELGELPAELLRAGDRIADVVEALPPVVLSEHAIEIDRDRLPHRFFLRFLPSAIAINRRPLVASLAGERLCPQSRSRSRPRTVRSTHSW